MRVPLKRLTIPAAILILLAVWWIAARLTRPEPGSGPVLLPAPQDVLEDVRFLFQERGFVGDILQSLKRILLGLLASTVPSVALGIWLGVSPRAYSVASPLFAFAKYIPPTAFVPILILWMGIGLLQQVSLLFIGTFFYLTVMVAETVAATPSTLKDAARTLGTRGNRLIWRVIIPRGLPDFFQHMRVMFGIAWTYLTVAEMVAARDGIGRVIIDSQRYLQTGRVIVGMVTIGALGLLSDVLLVRLSRLCCRWVP